MNAPKEKFLSVTLGEAEVRVPAEAATLAYLQQLLEQQREIRLPLRRTDRLVDYAMSVGTKSEHGEIYAGLSLDNGHPCELWLLPGENESCTWEEAKAWAAKQDETPFTEAYLPSRFDMLVLLKNLKGEFKEAPYWTSEEHADDAGYAWYQIFTWGNQDVWHKSGKYRARAVRRSPI